MCPGLVVPSEDDSISDGSMWNEMRDIFTDDVLERVKRAYLFRRLGTGSEVANWCLMEVFKRDRDRPAPREVAEAS